jgi:nitroreductase
MSFLDLAKNRYSCRSFKPEVISEQMLTELLEAFRIAPSAVNFQPWHIIIVKQPANLAKLYEAYPRDWFKTAPLVLIICGNHNVSWKRGSDNKDHLNIDIAVATDHLTLQATDMGLATCWVCNFKPEIVRHHFHLPENFEPVALIPVGYPNDTTDIARHSEKRKALKDIISYEKY